MGAISIRKVVKRYGAGPKANPVIHGVNAEIADGEFIVIVGPSGCGKSTLLRMVAGLEEISEGEIAIGGRVVNDVEPSERDIAMVFQNYALYPHMSVYDNMAYGLKIAKRPKDEIDARVRKAAAILELGALLDRTPRQLTTGNRKVLKVEDMKGLKVRVPETPTILEVMKAWGAAPTPVPASELYLALKQGLVDGQDNGFDAIAGAKYHEVQKYAMRIDYITPRATSGFTDDGQLPPKGHTGLYRNPLPLSGGQLVSVHTSTTRRDQNEGTSERPASRYEFRLKELVPSAGYWGPGDPLTPGLTNSVWWWSPDLKVSYDGPLWELDPVEVRPRPRPAASGGNGMARTPAEASPALHPSSWRSRPRDRGLRVRCADVGSLGARTRPAAALHRHHPPRPPRPRRRGRPRRRVPLLRRHLGALLYLFNGVGLATLRSKWCA